MTMFWILWFVLYYIIHSLYAMIYAPFRSKFSNVSSFTWFSKHSIFCSVIVRSFSYVIKSLFCILNWYLILIFYVVNVSKTVSWWLCSEYFDLCFITLFTHYMRWYMLRSEVNFLMCHHLRDLASMYNTF